MRTRVLAFGLAAIVGVTIAGPALAAMSRDQALAALKDGTTIYTRVCGAGPKDPPPIMPAGVEARMARALDVAQGVLAKSDDKDLRKALIDFIVASDCSADEHRAFVLGAIWHGNPEPLQKDVAALGDAQRCIMVQQLDWGWENEIYGKPAEPNITPDRVARLKTLKDGAPKGCLSSDDNG